MERKREKERESEIKRESAHLTAALSLKGSCGGVPTLDCEHVNLGVEAVAHTMSTT